MSMEFITFDLLNMCRKENLRYNFIKLDNFVPFYRQTYGKHFGLFLLKTVANEIVRMPCK